MVPIIETARLRLRAFQESDLDADAAMLADPIVMQYLGETPLSREESWGKMLRRVGLWALLGYGYWAVERKADGVLLGQAGFADFKRGIRPSIEGRPEMGWIFASHAHRQGYAAEAVMAAIAWSDGALKGQKLVAIIDPQNLPSIRLAEKAGFSRRQEAVYKDEPILLFTRPVPSPA